MIVISHCSFVWALNRILVVSSTGPCGGYTCGRVWIDLHDCTFKNSLLLWILIVLIISVTSARQSSVIQLGMWHDLLSTELHCAIKTTCQSFELCLRLLKTLKWVDWKVEVYSGIPWTHFLFFRGHELRAESFILAGWLEGLWSVHRWPLNRMFSAVLLDTSKGWDFNMPASVPFVFICFTLCWPCVHTDYLWSHGNIQLYSDHYLYWANELWQVRLCFECHLYHHMSVLAT